MTVYTEDCKCRSNGSLQLPYENVTTVPIWFAGDLASSTARGKGILLYSGTGAQEESRLPMAHGEDRWPTKGELGQDGESSLPVIFWSQVRTGP